MSEFTVKGEAFDMLDPTKMTFAEAAAVERVTGHTFQQIQSDETVSGSVIVVQAMLWVSMKRKQPELAFKDLGELAMGDIEFAEEPKAVEADPTQAEDAPSAA